MLDSRLAGLNTIVLVTSGWAAARGTAAARASEPRSCATGFFSRWDSAPPSWRSKLASTQGIAKCQSGNQSVLHFTLSSDRFHLLHVCLGIVILAVVCRARPRRRDGTAFWRMVDLVWVVMTVIIWCGDVCFVLLNRLDATLNSRWSAASRPCRPRFVLLGDAVLLALAFQGRKIPARLPRLARRTRGLARSGDCVGDFRHGFRLGRFGRCLPDLIRSGSAIAAVIAPAQRNRRGDL